MILTIDIGNTNITFGMFEGENLIGTFRMTTDIPRTSDEYGIFICEALKVKGLTSKVEGVVISSVVPNIMYSFESGIKKYLGVNPVKVGVGTKTGLRIVTAHPSEIGADRIVDAVAAYEIYGGPILVIDYGTATTYDIISADGAFLAGVTSPGIKISANALWRETAKLPEIEIKKPESILAKETITSMQAGLVYGYIGQTEYIIRKVKEELGLEYMKVVATGGLGKIIADETDAIEIYDPDLTLHGLKIIYDKNKR
ncbi:type III pantothenate kinase [Anaeromicropila populeti]|uniref:Type III pantothenate kinase n=1 Tax=Anaeromicropila populeti TaxID=37658 RepID=A0A1I6JZG5_9FIRM|nr:type III pantothenate kinase [Anaeromicropila populeti]SFR84268.1 pantothenate kinase [Anaeromicropila populeti]